MPLPHGTTSMHALGYILAVAASVLWGLTYCLDERVLEHLSVFKLYFLHCVCGAVVAAVILIARGTPPEALFSIGNATVSLPLFGLTLATAAGRAASRPIRRTPSPTRRQAVPRSCPRHCQTTG